MRSVRIAPAPRWAKQEQTKAKAIEAIETVAELTHEIAESDPSVTSQIAVDLVEGIAASFTLQDSTPSNANLQSAASAHSPRRQL